MPEAVGAALVVGWAVVRRVEQPAAPSEAEVGRWGVRQAVVAGVAVASWAGVLEALMVVAMVAAVPSVVDLEEGMAVVTEGVAGVATVEVARVVAQAEAVMGQARVEVVRAVPLEAVRVVVARVVARVEGRGVAMAGAAMVGA